MLKRLKSRREFLRVAHTRKKWAAPGLVLQVALRDVGNRQSADETAGGEIRVGFTVSRKVGGAVVRNRARRRLRAAAEQVMSTHAAGGRDYVLIGRSATVARPFAALVGDIEQALRHVDAYRDGAGADGRRNGI